MSQVSIQEQLDRANELSDVRPEDSASIYLAVISNGQLTDEESLKLREQAIYDLSDLYTKHKQANDLASLVRATRPFLETISKAKAAKLVRTLLDKYLSVGAATQDAVRLCQESIEWTKDEKRTYLRQALEAKLIGLYTEVGNFTDALALSTSLLKELKKLDDKALLVEVNLLDSKIYHLLSNVPKARASLTSARTFANAIYVPPLLQAALDLQGGLLHAEEKDLKTAYSYFYEAFEGYDSLEHKEAVTALKYMLLTKILLSSPDDVQTILTGKLALRYVGREVDALRSVANAYKARSLEDFDRTLQSYQQELTGDRNIKTHLTTLYDTLLEQNLSRIIEPFSRVEIAHVASLINLPLQTVESKLSQMILDKKLCGILDQGTGCLIVFDEQKVDRTYDASIITIKHMGDVVESLFKKAQKMF